MANYYVCFNITVLVLYGSLLLINIIIRTTLYARTCNVQRKNIIIFYIFTLMRLLQKERWQTLLRPFQYVGRMALTNYISHTIVTLLV
ncbi:DUF418 domain-containing protein, partial [Bacillus cereus]|uniref:DUF418 domain-containing protein n=1 Tax=Bacillus cereus TaxID=1396 RepID=UPI003C2DF14E